MSNNPPIIDFSAHSYGNTSNRPVYVHKAAPVIADSNLLPVNHNLSDISFDRSEILRGAEIPEVIPALLGIRSRLIERRIAKKQEDIERLDHEAKVISHIGESILSRNGYTKPDDSFRPSTPSEMRSANRLERITKKRLRGQSVASSADQAYRGLKENPETLSPVVKPVMKKLLVGRLPSAAKLVKNKFVYQSQSGQVLTANEKANVAASARSYKSITNKGSKLDDKFKSITHKPARKIAKLINKRDKLVAKSMAFDLKRYK